MWCPKCKREYREGFTECAYCHVSLVEEEPADTEDEPDNRSVDFSEADREALAQELANDPELNKALSEETDAAENEARKRSLRFRTATERANDMKTSGMTLSVLGVLGLIVIILIFTGVIKLNLTGVGAYISYATMFVLFALFTVIGIRSLTKVKPLMEEAQREEGKIKEIEGWFLKEYDKDKIDKAVGTKEENDFDDVYYGRVEFMRDKINSRFIELDPLFLDYIIEGLYQKLFDENEDNEENRDEA